MDSTATKATVKGHGYTVGDQVNFHGMGNDSFPATDPTPCILSKEGNKYTLTSVEPDHLGKPWVWTFGTAASFWASPVEKVEITEHVHSDGTILYSGKCAHGWGTGLYADRDDAIAVAAGHGEVSIPVYVAPEVSEVEEIAMADTEAWFGEVVKVSEATMDKFSLPTNTPEITGYFWQRYVLPGDYVTALSTYQLVQDGTTCQVAATVKYVKDGMWQASGCVWMSTSLTEGYWQGESLADAFAHVVQYMTWVSSVLGVGLNWAEINRLDWRTPYVAPENSKGACICDKIIDAGPKALPRTGGRTCPCGSVFTRSLKPLSAPTRAKLNKRARKAAKRHAFAGKR